MPAGLARHLNGVLYISRMHGHVCRWNYNTDLSAEVTHGCCVAAWDVGLPEPFAVTAEHFSPFSTLRRPVGR